MSIGCRNRNRKVGNIERLESRCLLSVAPVAIPASIVGPAYTGMVHLRHHAAKHIVAHSQTAPVIVEFSSLSNSVLEGSISTGDGQVNFSGPAKGRSFAGVFADGAINGKFTRRALSVHGRVRETVDGQIITGHYSATFRSTSSSMHRKHEQAGSTLTQTSASAAVGGVSTAPTTVGPTAQGAAIASISLPALETSFSTPFSLNPTTTSGGAAMEAQAIANSFNNDTALAGLGANAPGISSTMGNGTGNSTYSFSTSSGIVSLTNSGTTFTASSGIVSINAIPTYTPSSGIAPITDAGI